MGGQIGGVRGQTPLELRSEESVLGVLAALETSNRVQMYDQPPLIFCGPFIHAIRTPLESLPRGVSIQKF